MFEHELNPAAAKFISSLVKSLQILCNGQVEFNESIELIGHINVRVDRVHKYDYIVDEHVSKEGTDSSTTFLSNSYHSFPPAKSLPPLSSQSEIHSHHSKNATRQDISTPHGNQNYKVNHKVPTDSSQKQQDNIMVKMEGSESDCMVLPASPEEYETVEDTASQGGGSHPGTSSTQSESFEMDYDVQPSRTSSQTRRKRKAGHNSQEGASESKVFPNRFYHENYTSAEQQSPYVQCDQCGQWFHNAKDLQLHHPTCPMAARHTGRYNNEYGESWPAYHQDAHHTSQSLPPESAEADTDSDTCSCPICGTIFQNGEERLQHMNAEHNVTIYPCTLCPCTFGSSRALVQHKKVKHGELNPNQLKCTMCEKSFTTPLNLRGHMNMHLGLKPYECCFCGESFAYSQSKHRHQKFCKRSSRFASSVTHYGEYPHQ